MVLLSSHRTGADWRGPARLASLGVSLDHLTAPSLAANPPTPSMARTSDVARGHVGIYHIHIYVWACTYVERGMGHQICADL